MNGAHHFNEVILDGTFVPDAMVFGEIGKGWQQVTAELSFERSGPERFLSTFILLDAYAESVSLQAIPRSSELGSLGARIAGLHQMSTAVAGALERHEPADLPAAVVKLLGATTEGDIAEFAHFAIALNNVKYPGRYASLEKYFSQFQCTMRRFFRRLKDHAITAG